MNKDLLTRHISDIQDKQLIKGVLDLYEQTCATHKIRHTKFLYPYQIDYCKNILCSLDEVSHQASSLNDDPERQIIYFFPNYIDPADIESALSILRIEPDRNGEKLAHGDFLGAILATGISRNCVGDILFSNNIAYAVILKSVESLLLTNLARVGNSNVSVCAVESLPPRENAFSERVITVASLRLDGIVASIINGSRTKSQALIRNGTVKINSQEIKNNAKSVNFKDRITIRGVGKFVIDELLSETKKNRYRIRILKYEN